MAQKSMAPVGALITFAILGIGVASWVGADKGGTWRPTHPDPIVTSGKTSPVPSATFKRTEVAEWPDCGYALPTCVRLEGDQWYVIRDYQGDKSRVTLVGTVVRGDIVYRTVKEEK